MRKVTVELPNSLVDRIERIEGVSIEEFVEARCREHFDDGRRTQIELNSLALSWHVDVYNAIIDHVEAHGVAKFVREAIYDDLSDSMSDLIPPPDWQQTARESKGKRRKSKIKASPGRTSVIRHVALPQQWIDRIGEKHKHVGRYVKAVTQIRLEKETKKQYPVMRGLGDYLSHD